MCPARGISEGLLARCWATDATTFQGAPDSDPARCDARVATDFDGLGLCERHHRKYRDGT